jgi:hypothetical protein
MRLPLDGGSSINRSKNAELSYRCSEACELVELTVLATPRDFRILLQ